MCKGLVFAVTNDHVLASIVTQLIKSFLIEAFIYHAGVIQAQMSACHCWILWVFLAESNSLSDVSSTAWTGLQDSLQATDPFSVIKLCHITLGWIEEFTSMFGSKI